MGHPPLRERVVGAQFIFPILLSDGFAGVLTTTEEPMNTLENALNARALGRKPTDDQIDVYGLTHPGKVRKDNQDHFLISSLLKRMEVHQTSLPDPGKVDTETERLAFLCMVADGVGGGPKGEAASRREVTVSWSWWPKGRASSPRGMGAPRDSPPLRSRPEAAPTSMGSGGEHRPRPQLGHVACVYRFCGPLE